MGLLQQTWTLTLKNVLIALNRHLFSTSIRAFFLPVGFIIFLSYARNLFVPAAIYGVGSGVAVRSLQDGLDASAPGRDKVALVNNGFTGGLIDQVVDVVAQSVNAAGKNATILSNEDELLTVCKSSLRGVTGCYGAIVFEASPTEGLGEIWNYTLRADGALGTSIDVTSHSNDAEVYLLPLQHAVDFAIAGLNTTINQAAIPSSVLEYPYTSMTQAERNTQIRTSYQKSIVDVLGIGFLIGMVGVTYHLTGFMASERELGMSQLIEAMMPNTKRWQPQIARIVSYHLGFSIIYLPGWIAMGVVLGVSLWTNSTAIAILFHLISGLALTSFSILGAAFFKKAQLSGITLALASLLLGVLAQVLDKSGSGTVLVLSLLFAPCNYVYFVVFIARYEHENMATNLIKSAPNNWNVPGIVLWIFMIVQIFVYPLLGALIERSLYGTASKGRSVVRGQMINSSDSTIEDKSKIGTTSTVQLEKFSKHYYPNIFRRIGSKLFGSSRRTVVAVNGLTLAAAKGQILVLLGANGSGKSTTLDAIAGLNTITSGTIAVDGTGGIGIAPQKNVLWDELTVLEHIRIFSRLKSRFAGHFETKTDIRQMITAIDLDRKIQSKAKTLSGGQKRKLQLGMMFTGGSAVCCVDEVSSGLDPLSRRKIWDILLAERGARTIIMTTHFLDEADLLADQIVILSKGTLRASGSSVELKDTLGGGYRVRLHTGPGHEPPPAFDDIEMHEAFDQATYFAATSAQAAQLVRSMEKAGVTEYQLSGPTIEDVFLRLAEEIHIENQAFTVNDTVSSSPSNEVSDQNPKVTRIDYPQPEGLQLLTGRRIGFFRQAWVLFRKRLTILRRNYLPTLAAFLIPIIAAGLVMLFIQSYQGASCTPSEQVSNSDFETLETQQHYDLLVGTSAAFSNATVTGLFSVLLPGFPGVTPAQEQRHVNFVETSASFNQYISQNYANVTPGGAFLGGSATPVFAYKGNGDIYSAVFAQNIMDVMLTNISIATQYASFDIPWSPSTGKSLELVVYFGLAMAAAPAFFSLYPTVERLRNVRSLEYSNGVRSLPLWLAYLFFDFIVVVVASALVVVIFATLSTVWYHVQYLFIIFVLFGLTSILWSYTVSLFARGQLAAFAFSAATQAVFFLGYLIAYLCTLTYAPVDRIDYYLLVVNYVVSAFTPMGSLIRTMFVALNLFSSTCVGTSIAPHPGGLNQYGGPILYLVLQSLALFTLLLWHDSGSVVAWYRRLREKVPENNGEDAEVEVADELIRVGSSSDGLRVLHLTKTFGKNTAVDNLSFGVKHGEVFALLGPNGAGKTTTISLIRGDIQPSRNGGGVFIENIAINKHRASARSHLGVCPQFDAMDQMTVIEHLRFYARVRGITDVEFNVKEVIRAVGLQNFSTRMAAKLSGGNKRKLSLGVALMGNPTVLILDEPSSGMDAAAKRVMWKTLASVVPGRSLLLTTHSMEEADALANRAGIMARHMLAMGTTDHLRSRHGDAVYVHLVTKSAPHTTDEEMQALRSWVVENFPKASVEEKAYHGQLRFSVAARMKPEGADKAAGMSDVDEIGNDDDRSKAGAGGIGSMITLLEDSKEKLGLEFYSCSPTTLDQVFLSIVEKHDVEEENYASTKPKKSTFRIFGRSE